MNQNLKIVAFPQNDIGDVAKSLRNLAESIEQGAFGEAHNLAWVIDCGDSMIECGLLGSSASPGAEAYFLFGLAKRKLESAIE